MCVAIILQFSVRVESVIYCWMTQAGEFGSTVEHDVNCAVELFAKSGRVPTSVMEAR